MRKWAAGLLVLLLGLSGCGAAQADTPALTRVILERGHGSMWGDQFYMDVCADEILQTHYFPADDPGGTLTEESGRPVTPEQWDGIVSAVEALEPSLVPVREPFWKKLLGRGQTLDGGEFHHLTLYWEDAAGIRYVWPANEQAAALETRLEQLALE